MAQRSLQVTLPDYPDEIQILRQELSFKDEELLRFYSSMRLARTFEEKLAALYRQGKIFGAVYLGMGQEATSVGSASQIEKTDYLSMVARNLSAYFYRGVEPRHVMARWFGKDQAPSHGRELGLFLRTSRTMGSSPITTAHGVVDSSGRGLRAGLQGAPAAERDVVLHRGWSDEPGRLL